MMNLDPDTRRLLIEQVAHTLNVNLQPMLAEIVAAATRPSVLYRPDIGPRSIGGWYAQYRSVRGEGATPEEAVAVFDKKWSAR